MAWQDIVPLPVVIDADVLSRSVDHALRTSWNPAVVQNASPSYTNFTGITLFATERVVEETFRRFNTIAAARRVTIADVERTWDDLFCKRVRVVDMSGMRVDDPRVDDVTGRDPDDEPTAKLAVLLAPCALLTDNWAHFQAFRAKQPHPTRTMDATTAYALDVRDLGEFLQMLNAGTLPPRLAGIAAFEGGKALVRWVGRDAALALVLLLLGGVAIYLRTEGGRRLREGAFEAAKQLAAEHGPALAAAFDAGIATAERLTAFAVQPGSRPSPTAVVARELAHRGVMATAEIADHLLRSGYRFTPASSHRKRVLEWLLAQSCFWEPHRGRWTLGYHQEPLTTPAETG